MQNVLKINYSKYNFIVGLNEYSVKVMPKGEYSNNLRRAF